MVEIEEEQSALPIREDRPKSGCALSVIVPAYNEANSIGDTIRSLQAQTLAPTEIIVVEDMDLTWTFYEAGHQVRFVPEAVCYPIEPHNFDFMSKQLRRWSHGFIQNVRVHWRDILSVPFLRSAVAVALWDAGFASLVFLFLLPLLAVVLRAPWLLLGYLIDAPAVLIPVLAGAIPRREAKRALASFPAFFVLRTLNAIFFLRAVWCELIAGRTLRAYEKGH